MTSSKPLAKAFFERQRRLQRQLTPLCTFSTLIMEAYRYRASSPSRSRSRSLQARAVDKEIDPNLPMQRDERVWRLLKPSKGDFVLIDSLASLVGGIGNPTAEILHNPSGERDAGFTESEKSLWKKTFQRKLCDEVRPRCKCP